MKLYFAGNGHNNILAKYKVPHLVTFAYKDQAEDYFNLCNEKVFMDSGAFTAFTKGKIIDINSYIDFINKHKDKIEVYCVLDVIKDPKGTMENQIYMESKGLKPLPVFHVGADFKELLNLIKRYDYIALGGLVPYSMNKPFLESYLDTVFYHVQNKVKLHGFGLNAEWAWKKYPFYSVDSSSWLSGGRFAQLSINGKKHTKKSKSTMGMKLHTESYKVIDELSIIEYQKKVQYITDLWKLRGIIWN